MLTIAMATQISKANAARPPPTWSCARIAVAKTPRVIDPRAMTVIATLPGATDGAAGCTPGDGACYPGGIMGAW